MKAKTNSMKIMNKLKRSVASVISGIIFAVGFLGICGILLGCSGRSATYNLNDSIQTNRFEMTVTEAKIIRGSFGGLSEPESGYDRLLIDMIIKNNNDFEDINFNIGTDFYLQTSGTDRIEAKNTGGGADIFDSLGQDGVFYNSFALSRGKLLQGYVAFDIPKTSTDVLFVYQEGDFQKSGGKEGGKKGEKVSEVLFYKVTVPYTSPLVHSGGTNAVNYFERRALNAGYVLEIEHDYDGYGTFWMGAHRYPDWHTEADTTKRSAPLYTVDLTVDRLYGYADEEFDEYVGQVIEIGGAEMKDAYEKNGYTYRYQANSSDTRFGMAYRGGTLNIFVVADAQYKSEIVSFVSPYLSITI